MLKEKIGKGLSMFLLSPYRACGGTGRARDGAEPHEGKKKMKRRIKEIFKRAAEILKLAAYTTLRPKGAMSLRARRSSHSIFRRLSLSVQYLLR